MNWWNFKIVDLLLSDGPDSVHSEAAVYKISFTAFPFKVTIVIVTAGSSSLWVQDRLNAQIYGDHNRALPNILLFNSYLNRYQQDRRTSLMGIKFDVRYPEDQLIAFPNGVLSYPKCLHRKVMIPAFERGNIRVISFWLDEEWEIFSQTTF